MGDGDDWGDDDGGHTFSTMAEFNRAVAAHKRKCQAELNIMREHLRNPQARAAYDAADDCFDYNCFD